MQNNTTVSLDAAVQQRTSINTIIDALQAAVAIREQLDSDIALLKRKIARDASIDTPAVEEKKDTQGDLLYRILDHAEERGRKLTTQQVYNTYKALGGKYKKAWIREKLEKGVETGAIVQDGATWEVGI